MGDIPDENVEEIFAEEDEQSKSRNVLSPFNWVALVSNIIADYGWFLLFGLIGLYVLWKKLLEPKWEKWRAARADSQESARYHKDPDLALRRMQGMEAARQRMQALHSEAALKHLDKMKEKEETKRLEKIEDWERHKKGLGYCNKIKVQETESLSQTTSKNTKHLSNNDYNPLVGSSGGGYRPSRKGPSGGCPSCQ